MNIFKLLAKSNGCLGNKNDPRDYQRKFFFGAEERKVPETFEPEWYPGITDQGQSMACTFFSYFGQALPLKVYKETGERIVVDNETIKELWNHACELGLASKTQGAYIETPCEYHKAHPLIFRTETGRNVLVSLQKYFQVDDGEVDEEIYYGGAVLTGTSSRTGLDVSAAGSSPYFIASKKSAKSDGHAHCQIAKRKQNDYNPARRLWQKITAWVHPNSWGMNWGDSGYMYTKSDQQSKLFRGVGFTITCDFPDEEPTIVEEGPFDDIEKGSWYYDAVLKAHKAGILKGENRKFRPADPVSRAEIAVILDRLNLLK
jgi:hypothetical protein